MIHLCLRCRKSGHRTKECPEKQASPVALGCAVVAPKTSGANLCQRCKDLKVIDLLLSGVVNDEFDGTSVDKWSNSRHFKTLGPYRDIVFDGTCPLCRLIFSIFPAPDPSLEPDTDYLLRPLRTYNRLARGYYAPDDNDEAAKRKYTVSISVSTRPSLSKSLFQRLALQENSLVSEYSFALTSNTAIAKQQGLPARVRDVGLDFDLLEAWLHRCETHHQDCPGTWSDELLTTRMIDIDARAVVPCPPHCRYIALSYVWGGVSPQPDALKNGTLPATIEDAIVVTRRLGIRYLWVDALCIDQTPSPEKLQQLGIMDLIYAGAYATVIAFDGDSANVGLRGVSSRNPREPQACEWVDGYEMAVVFPPNIAESRTAKHAHRAWTMQEVLLSHRRIFFGHDQVHYACMWMNMEESIDERIDPAKVMEEANVAPDVEFWKTLQQNRTSAADEPSLALRRRAAASYYTTTIENYTARAMTYDSDALNACQGLLNYLQRNFSLSGFDWGLPVRDFPLSLRWYHTSRSPPRRRSGFPSWSFVGWEGEADSVRDIAPEERHLRPDSDRQSDLVIRFVGVREKVLTLDGYCMRLEIRKEPFNEAYFPGTDKWIGMLREGFQHQPNTLPAGVFDFVVTDREVSTGGSRPKHTVFLLLLEGQHGGTLSRRTMVQWFVDRSFTESKEYATMFHKQNIQLV